MDVSPCFGVSVQMLRRKIHILRFLLGARRFQIVFWNLAVNVKINTRLRRTRDSRFSTIAFTVHFQDVHMMGQPVEQCARETFGAEGFRPFFERQIAGDQS